jgi:hypothetical protein
MYCLQNRTVNENQFKIATYQSMQEEKRERDRRRIE